MRISRALLVIPVLVVGLSGCEALKGGKFSIADAQAAAVKACSFLPTANTVANIIAAGSPALNTASAIGDAICAAIAPKAGVGAGKPTVVGVPIEGQRVN